MFESKAVTFDCLGAKLHGILDSPFAVSKRAVLIVVGGPQYRIGGHRQFTLLSRRLAGAGVPTLRFDHRGIGDSDGDVSFDQMGPDIAAAINKLCAELPEVREIVLWGLCDAASAAMMYAPTDTRVKGIILLNPWIRDEKSLAQTYLKHYYISQLFDSQFWRRLLTGKLQIVTSLRSFLHNMWLASKSASPQSAVSLDLMQAPFQSRMQQGLSSFQGNIMFVISGDDLTAAEFVQQTAANDAWQEILTRDRVRWEELPESNHTFSRQEWRQRVENWSLEWISSW